MDYFKKIIPCDNCGIMVSRLEYYHNKYKHDGYRFKFCALCVKHEFLPSVLIEKNLQKIRNYKLDKLLS